MERATMRDPRWYSPENVVSHFHNDLGYPLDQTKINRKAEELYVTAVTLLGMQKIEKGKYWIQPVSDIEESPDVRTITLYERQDGRAPDGAMQDVEVVNYEFSSEESLPDFLARTKLSSEKAYDDKTTILLRVKEQAKCPPANIWVESLKNVKSKSPVIILGRNDINEPDYSLIQVHPIYKELIDFNLLEVLKEQTDNVGTMNLGRGSKNTNIKHSNQKHCPFESLGIGCKVKYN